MDIQLKYLVLNIKSQGNKHIELCYLAIYQQNYNLNLVIPVSNSILSGQNILEIR